MENNNTKHSRKHFAAQGPVEIKAWNQPSDASGIVGWATCAGFTFQFSWLGFETSVKILNTTGSFRGSKIAMARVEREVTSRVLSETTEEWRAACTAMYSE
jgi:hypothetical protein